MDDCTLCNPEKDTVVREYEKWKLLVNYMQPTLGSTLLVPNRHVESFPDLTREEVLEHLDISNYLEGALKRAFNPDRVNYLMLANVVTHIHFHVVPRYSSNRCLAGLPFRDEKYGHTPVLSSDRKSPVILKLVKEKLLEHLN